MTRLVSIDYQATTLVNPQYISEVVKTKILKDLMTMSFLDDESIFVMKEHIVTRVSVQRLIPGL